jgi:hypothetical protein
MKKRDLQEETSQLSTITGVSDTLCVLRVICFVYRGSYAEIEPGLI